MDFRIAPTLLDTFCNYLEGKWSTTAQDVIDKINRKPYEPSEAMAKGTAFHELTDGRPLPKLNRKAKTYDYKLWGFKKDPVEEIRNIRLGGISEAKVERVMEIGNDRILLYGYIDTIKNGIDYDVKTCKRYKGVGAYYGSMQWRTYLYCTGSENFQFIVTDFNRVYFDDYTYSEFEENKLREKLSLFVQFIKENKSEITHPRIFDYSPQDPF